MTASGSTPRKGLLRSALIGFGFLAAAAPAFPQAPSGPIAPNPGQQAQSGPAQKGPDQPIRVRVDLVNAPVVVRDNQGEMVLDLSEKSFRIFDNGVEQRLEAFDLGGAPLSVVLVMETSSRIQALLPAIRRTGVLFTETVIGENGDAAVIGFNDDVTRLLDFTSDHDAVDKAITNLQSATSGARLYDALSQAVGLLRNRPASRRRVIITVAEAVDSGSEDKLGQVLQEAQLANITIYSIGLSSTSAEMRTQRQTSGPSITPPGTFGAPSMPGSPQTPTSEQQRGGNIDLMALAVWVVQHAETAVKERPLELAATATGGSYQSPLRDSAIEKAVDQIGGELHAQYTLSYRPTGTDPAGYHEIRVQVVDRRALNVRSRPGYYLGPPGA